MGQAFDDVHAVYCYFESGIILSGVSVIPHGDNLHSIVCLFLDSTSKNSR